MHLILKRRITIVILVNIISRAKLAVSFKENDNLKISKDDLCNQLLQQGAMMELDVSQLFSVSRIVTLQFLLQLLPDLAMRK